MTGINKKMIGSVIILCILITCVSNTNGQKQNMNCNFWQSRVNPEIKMHSKEEKPSTDLKVLLKNNNSFVPEEPFNNLNQRETFFGIECLLNLEGNKKNSNLSGATRPDVSQTFGATTVEVAALYYVSYLFYQKWDHADAPFLVSQKNSKLNSDKAVSKAYKAYKKWFEKVREIGIEEARKQKLDPLEGSGVRWY
jgi:hypothetical protein